MVPKVRTRRCAHKGVGGNSVRKSDDTDEGRVLAVADNYSQVHMLIGGKTPTFAPKACMYIFAYTRSQLLLSQSRGEDKIPTDDAESGSVFEIEQERRVGKFARRTLQCYPQPASASRPLPWPSSPPRCA